MTPCVYIKHPDSGRGAYFTSCESVNSAVQVARMIATTFQCPAWVAGWRQLAHTPFGYEIEFEKAEAARAETAL